MTMLACGSAPCDSNEECPEQQYCEISSRRCIRLTGECTPGTQRACYSGAGTTRQVSPCKDGLQKCLPAQKWGPCEGERTPRAEVCNGQDDNCNQQVDDQCKVADFCKQTDFSQWLEVQTNSTPGSPHRLEVRFQFKKSDVPFRWLDRKPSLKINPSDWKQVSLQFNKDKLPGYWVLILEKTGDWDKAVTVQFESTVIATAPEQWHCPITLTSPARSLVCQEKLHDCKGRCVSLRTDSKNCGKCGVQCASGQPCCEGSCTDLKTSLRHCGACGNACPPSTDCLEGRCVRCRANVECKQGQLCRSGRCIQCPGDKACDSVLFLPGSNQTRLHQVAVQKSGDIVLAGSFHPTLTIGGQTLKATLNNDLFVARYSGDWSKLHWVRQLGSKGVDGRDYFQKEHPYLLGFADDSLLLAGQSGHGRLKDDEFTLFVNVTKDKKVLPPSTWGRGSSFLTSLSGQGSLQWVKRLDDWVFQGISAIQSNPAKGIWLSQWSYVGKDPFDCGGKKLGTSHKDITSAARQLFLHLSPKGECQWGYVLRLPNQFSILPLSSSIVVDKSGNSTWLGHISPGQELAGQKPPVVAGAKSHSFLARFSPAGTLLWLRWLGAETQMFARKLTMDSKGNLYVAGQFKGQWKAGKDTLQAAGKWDLFVARMTSDGSFVWVRKAGGIDNEDVLDWKAGPNGKLCLLSWFLQDWKVADLRFASKGKKDLAITCWRTDGTFLSTEVVGGEQNDTGTQLYWSADTLFVTGSTASTSLQVGQSSYQKTLTGYQETGFVWKWKP